MALGTLLPFDVSDRQQLAVVTATKVSVAMSFDFDKLFSFDFGATINKFVTLLNANTGVLALGIFLATLVLAWISGIFAALMRKPKFLVRIINGPTFACTYRTGRKHGEFDEHRTGVALYLDITNAGAAPSSITSIEIGYHWHLRPFSKIWLQNSIGWFWLKNQSVALVDFQVAIGESIKVFPFLTQNNQLSPVKPTTYLRVGESTNGVVYFEQDNSWGGCFPKQSNGSTRVKIRVRDALGKKHDSKFNIPVVSLEKAKEYNPRFGETHSELRGEFLSTDEEQISRDAAGASNTSDRQT